jgi:hypothetical protein
MGNPLSNPSPPSGTNAYPEDPAVQRPADGTKTREVVQEYLGRKGPQEQPRHPVTGRYV